MTINSSVRTAGPFIGTGLVSVYPFAFKIFQSSDLLVVRQDTSGNQSTLALSVDYTVALNTDQNAAPGGFFALTSPLPIGYLVTATSNIALLQPLALTNLGGFFPRNIEDEFDRLTIILQQLGVTGVAQSLRVPEIGGIAPLGVVASRANNLLGFDSLGNPVAVAPVSGSAASLATDLTNSALAAKGAGQIGFGYALGYAVGTIGRWLQDLATSTGAGLIGWLQIGTGAVLRTLASKLLERPMSVFDFMTAAQIADVQARTLTLDVTAPINAAFAAAATANRTVDAPDGSYLVGNLLFGSQATVAQSAAPRGLVGSSRTGCIFVAKAGLTGTLLQGWSLAGVQIRDFTITTTGTTAQAMDLEWKPGAGPSTQNIVENIVVNGGAATTHVSLKNLNDTVPYKLVVNGTAHSQCGINFSGSGGLNTLRDCIWNGCYLQFGSQNGVIDNCWGHGIQFAQACTNYVHLIGGYIYWNTNKLACLWSESYASFQSVHGLVLSGTQLIGPAANSAGGLIDINLYSKIDAFGNQFTSAGGTCNLYGPNVRNDTTQKATVDIHGGSYLGAKITINDPVVWNVNYDNLINDTTGLAYAPTFTPTIVGATAAGVGTYSVQAGTYTRIGNKVFFEGRLTWSAHTGTGNMQLGGLPGVMLSTNGAMTIGYAGSTFASVSNLTQVTVSLTAGAANFWALNGATGASAAIALRTSGDLIFSGWYTT
jgi:hypothetical protein